MYRVRGGMGTWILHRVTGVAVLLFLFAHIIDTALVAWPDVYDTVIGIYHHPFFRFMEIILVGGVMFHAVNGLRVIVIDFWSKGSDYNRQLTIATYVVFALLYVPAAGVMFYYMFRSFGGGA